jgi:hypothetical protein
MKRISGSQGAGDGVNLLPLGHSKFLSDAVITECGWLVFGDKSIHALSY